MVSVRELTSWRPPPLRELARRARLLVDGPKPRPPSAIVDALQRGASPATDDALQTSTPTFCVGMGRSGTHFIQRVMEPDASLASYHLDNVNDSVGDAFVCYCAWNDLPVDLAGFVHGRRVLVGDALAAGRRYIEANPYLALSVSTLRAGLHAQFIYVVRSPEAVVNSHYIKGWYAEAPTYGDASLSLGYQYDADRGNHFFGRVVPRGSEHERWRALTQIGRIAWVWNAYNQRILDQLEALPAGSYRQVRIEEVDYPVYRELHAFAGGRRPLTADEFEEIRKARPGKGKAHRTPESWSTQERAEFERETAPVRDALGL